MNATRHFAALSFSLSLALVATSARAADKELDPKQKAALSKKIDEVARWAAEPKVIAEVKSQNARGPIADMDEAKWKATKRSDPLVKTFQSNAAGTLLADKLSKSNGTYVEAFLSAKKGEKVAFVSKTTSYVHAGKPKFDVPFTTGKAWTGTPEFDESTQSHNVQVSVPVRDGAETIGVLVVGVSLGALN